MAKFRVGYSEEYYGYVWFDADNIDDAKRIIEEAQTEWDVVEACPNFFQKVKGGGFEFDEISIEEVE